MIDRMSIPIQRNYNQILGDFQIRKIKSISKDNLIVELQSQESWIYELIKEDTINLFLNTGGYTIEKLTTDDLYKLAVDITAKQISKRCFFYDIEDYELMKDDAISLFLNIGYTNGIFSTDDLYTLGVDTTIRQISKRCFFSEIKNTELILKKIKSRIVNNIRNFFSPLRKTNYLNINQYFFSMKEYYEIFEKIIDELDLQKIDKKTIKIGLAKVWQDALTDTTFDIIDFEELCAKFKFKPDEVLGYNPYTIPPMAKEICNNGNYQLILIFEFEEVI